jgi:hypothetical protein
VLVVGTPLGDAAGAKNGNREQASG